MTSIVDLIAAGRYKFRDKARWFSAIALKLIIVEKKGLGTVAVTDRGHFLYDPAYLRTHGYDADCMAYDFCHEVLHVYLRHCQRVEGRVPRIWNLATDCALRSMCDDLMGDWKGPSEIAPIGPSTWGFPEALTADDYYILLLDHEKENGEGSANPNEGEGDGPLVDDPEGNDGEGDAKGSRTTGGAKRGRCGSCSGHAADGEPDDDGRSPGDLDRAVRNSAEEVQKEASKGRGTIPGALTRHADSILKPPVVPWESKFRRAGRRAVAWRMGAVDYRFDAPSRKQAASGYGIGKPIMPRLRNPRPGVLVAIDTSASMGKAELERALAEAQGVFKAIGCPVAYMACDSVVHGGVKVATSATDIVLRGGGGTNFVPVFKEAEKMAPRPDVVVFITDGGGPAPQHRPSWCEVIWVLVGRYRCKPCDWGDVIEIPEEDNNN